MNQPSALCEPCLPINYIVGSLLDIQTLRRGLHRLWVKSVMGSKLSPIARRIKPVASDSMFHSCAASPLRYASS